MMAQMASRFGGMGGGGGGMPPGIPKR